MSDIFSEEKRTKAFGLSGVAFGIGFLIGPGIGGFLSGIDFSILAFLAAGISMITMLISMFVLPETIKRKKKFEFDLKIFNFDEMRRYFRHKKISPKLLQLFTYLLAHVIWVSFFVLYTERQIGLDSAGVGYVLAYIGFISIILRGGLLPKLVDFFEERMIKYAGMPSIIIGMIFSVFVNSWEGILVLATLFSFGSGVTRSVMYIAQIVGPLIGGSMINYFFLGSVGLAAASVMIIGFITVLRSDFILNED